MESHREQGSCLGGVVEPVEREIQDLVHKIAEPAEASTASSTDVKVTGVRCQKRWISTWCAPGDDELRAFVGPQGPKVVL